VHQLPACDTWWSLQPRPEPRGCGHPDVGNPDGACVRGGRRGGASPASIAVSVQVSGRTNRGVEGLAGRGIETARDIDAEDGNPDSLMARIPLAWGSRGALRSPGAEDGVNDKIGPNHDTADGVGIRVHDNVDAAPSCGYDVVQHHTGHALVLGKDEHPHRTSQVARCRAATSPSPPLLPYPAITPRLAVPPRWRHAHRATCHPAISMS